MTLAYCRFHPHFRKTIVPAKHKEHAMQELTHWINGKHVKGTSGRFADVYNPATGEVQARVPLACHQPAASRTGDDGLCRPA
jgi:hypothetical protein